MIQKDKEQRRPKKVETTSIKEYVKQMPPPPKEHAYELKMEKRLKRLVGKERKKKAAKG
jgi:hypothetical protein